MVGDADLVLVDGRVFTSSRERPWARALAVRGDRVVAVGTSRQAEAWAGPRTRVLDLCGRVVVPGFVDAHAHMADAAGEIGWAVLDGARSLEDALGILRSSAVRSPGDAWVVGIGWDESGWPERRYLLREDLDRVATDRRVVAVRRDRHMGSLNSKALEAAEPFRGMRGFEVDPAGRPAGVLKEDAFLAFWERIEPSEEAVYAGLGTMARRAHRLGITSIHDIVDLRGIRGYWRARRAGRLGLRVYLVPRDDLLPSLETSGLSTGLGDAWLRLGAIKVFSDGSLGAYTAALDEPYAGRRGDRGILVHPPEELAALLARAHRAGFQTATHAIGDAAIRVVLEALEGVLAGEPRADVRHRIEHYELPDEDMLRRAKALRLVASCQPNFIGWCSGPGGTYEDRLGKVRARRNTPFRRILRRGISLCFGSDGMPYGPLYGLHWAVNGFFEDQRIPVEEAFRAYSAGGAYASFEEGDKGTLEAGRLADFLVLDGDPFHEPDRIREVRVESTWIGGRKVSGRSP